jgi:zinc transporter, ZIP family
MVACGIWLPFGRTVHILAGQVSPAPPHQFREKRDRGPTDQLAQINAAIAGHYLHNIPEGLAIGILFGAAAEHLDGTTVSAAIALAIGIGIQNIPEGMAVSMPLRRLGVSRVKSFWYGQLSAIVEPMAGVLGAVAVIYMQNILPFALSFAAGAMIFVVVEEVIPETQRDKYTDLAVLGFMLGFTIMMILDVALG